MNRTITASLGTAALVAGLGLSACGGGGSSSGSSPPTTQAPATHSAPATQTPAPISIPTAPVPTPTSALPENTNAVPSSGNCTQQVKEWLAYNVIQNQPQTTTQNEITLIVGEAHKYLSDSNPGWINDMEQARTELTESGVVTIPNCADPNSLYVAPGPPSESQFLPSVDTAWGDATSGTASVSIIQNDVRKVLSNFAALQKELNTTAPGNGMSS